jgi:recombination protein RecA
MFNQGISKMGDLLELGADQGIIKKSGSFYSYGETRLGQGRENSKEFLAQHPEIAASVEARIRGQEPGQEPATEVASATPEASGDYTLPGSTELDDSK